MKLSEALNEIDRIRHIGEFSAAVLKHDRQLRMVDHATFLQKTATDFQLRFVACFEEDIRVGKSLGYATTCDAVSRQAGGQAGIQACERIAACVSRLDKALIKKVGLRALSLFASSFGRYSRVAECRSATIRIAECCHDESRALQELNSQSLGLLVNGFSKWPEETASRQAAIAVAGEVLRRLGRYPRFSEFTPRGLANLVNGFSKWPKEAVSRKAIFAIAGEVLRRGDQLSLFNQQDWRSW
ncbi:hypothetical protein [Bradyrhizobium archetypum]|uniref:Uncharacterized protein n=1 Tax=Bradyrhizobium archetypum TaxID=2721160 RepID=A0A7Y4H9H5_9BRAD|nr:hypothetical protein [Bradyrhizobium archetypum]NOJ50136.1 hypothetical protein [Bradyrhizobium archetypum]